jgi:hypothetical protein
MSKEIRQHHQTLESLKHADDKAAKFRYARELQDVLDYSRWNKHGQVIADHFHQEVKMVPIDLRASENTRETVT